MTKKESKKEEILVPEVMDAINDIGQLTQSQIDRDIQRASLDKDLFGFFKQKIKQATDIDPVVKKAIELVADKLEKKPEDVSLNMLMNIIETFMKQDNDLSLGILKLAAEKEKAFVQIDIKKEGEGLNSPEGNTPLTKQNVQDANEAIQAVNDLKDIVSSLKKSEIE